MSWLWLYVVVALLMLVGAGCLKIGSWQSKEADYWYVVADAVELDPTLDKHFRPILEWTQAHKPSRFARLLPWKSPARRMMDS